MGGLTVRMADDMPEDAGRPQTNTAKRNEKAPKREAEQGSSGQPAAKRAKTDEAAAAPDTRSPEQKEADEFKEKGNQLYKQRKFNDAVEMYDKAIEKMPNDITYYNNRCAVWIELGEAYYPKVIECCQDLITRRYEINTAHPGGASFEKVAKVYNRLASLYEKQKKYDEAIVMY